MLRIYFTLVALGLAVLGTCARAEEPPERHFKPYPVKKTDAASPSSTDAGKPTSSSNESESKITGPTSLTTYKPFGVEPIASLKAHPPTSGREPMLTLGAKNKPYTEPVFESDKLSYYDCEGIVAPWFQELVTAEMNYFNELVNAHDQRQCMRGWDLQQQELDPWKDQPSVFWKCSPIERLCSR